MKLLVRNVQGVHKNILFGHPVVIVFCMSNTLVPVDLSVHDLALRLSDYTTMYKQLTKFYRKVRISIN